MLARRLFLSPLVFMLAACATEGSGLEIGVMVNDSPASTLLANRSLRIAAWVGVEPGPGVRPSEVIHIDDSDVPEDKCNHADATAINKFICKTNLRPKPGARLYVGAFYEVTWGSNLVPEDGELLAFVGPLKVPEGADKVEGIEIVVVNPDAPVLPDFSAILADTKQALIEGDLSRFMAHVHPFYSDSWNRDVEGLRAWLAGTFAGATTTYTDPLSGPAAGLLAAAVRANLAISRPEVTDGPMDANAYSAQWTVSYVATKAPPAQDRIIEVWNLNFRATDDDILLRRLEIPSQDVGGIDVVPGNVANGSIVFDWSDSQVPAYYRIEADYFDPESYSWASGATGTVDPSTHPLQCTIPSFDCIGGGLTLPDDLYYRFRVLRLDAARNPTSRPSSFFVAGQTYKYR